MKKLSLTLMTVLAAGLVTACQNEMAHNDSDHTHNMESGIVISSAYVMPPFPGKTVGAGFFEITNHGADDRLLTVMSDASSTVEIHTHIQEDGMMKMIKLDGIDLPKGETVVFKPGSYHLMMFDANMPEGTEDVSLTFTYANAEPVTLIAPIGEPKEDAHSEDHSGDHSGH
ncbi:copper chaperone PCu(A)C [Litorimonas sp. RW-G-Af-16]|uniref:copper chaperone PCu(A)C n=1 Tax=Litorimonas sp. RW-G-Af-16 TaxID=3241168 RepID=UPI00390C4FE8